MQTSLQTSLLCSLCLCGDNLTCCMLLQAEQRAAVHLLTRILNSVNTAAAAAALQRMTAWLHQHQAQDTRSGVSSLYPDQQRHQAQPAQHCRWWRGGGAATAQSRGTRGLAHTSTHVASYTRGLIHTCPDTRGLTATLMDTSAWQKPRKHLVRTWP